MLKKLFTALKFIICMTLGPAFLYGITSMLLGTSIFGLIVYLILVYMWFRYVLNFYYPRKNNNDIDFKDL